LKLYVIIKSLENNKGLEAYLKYIYNQKAEQFKGMQIKSIFFNLINLTAVVTIIHNTHE